MIILLALIIIFMVFIVMILHSNGFIEGLITKMPDVNSLTEQQRSTLYKITKKIHDICEKENIWYCGVSGTALGVVRHGKMIPWDDDVDLMVDHKKMDVILSYFPPSMIGKEKFTNVIKIHEPNMKYPFVDLFTVKINDKTGAVKCKNLLMRFQARREPVTIKRKKAKFGPIEIYIPGNDIEYLDKTYPNWRNDYKINKLHRKEK